MGYVSVFLRFHPQLLNPANRVFPVAFRRLYYTSASPRR